MGRAGPCPTTFWPLWAKKAHRGENGEEMPAQFSDASAAYGYREEKAILSQDKNINIYILFCL